MHQGAIESDALIGGFFKISCGVKTGPLMRLNVVSREIFNDEHRKASWSNARKDQVWPLEGRDSSTREAVIVQDLSNRDSESGLAKKVA